MKHIPAVIVSMCTLLASIPVYAQEISVESQNPNDFQDASASKIVPSAPAAAPDATMQQSSEGLPESTPEDAVPLQETTAPSESSSAEESKSIAEAAPPRYRTIQLLQRRTKMRMHHSPCYRTIRLQQRLRNRPHLRPKKKQNCSLHLSRMHPQRPKGIRKLHKIRPIRSHPSYNR